MIKWKCHDDGLKKELEKSCTSKNEERDYFTQKPFAAAQSMSCRNFAFTNVHNDTWRYIIAQRI